MLDSNVLQYAYDHIEKKEMIQLLKELIRIESPSGNERRICEYVEDFLNKWDIPTIYQPIDRYRGNVVSTLEADKGGKTLLLSTHLDTFYHDTCEISRFGLDPKRLDLRLEPTEDQGFIIGRGAENAKGYAVAVIGAMLALRKAEIPLKGNVIAGLVSGGIITRSQPASPVTNVALGIGTEHLLRYGSRPDYAVVAKGGAAISWESAGSCWIKVRVKGDHAYSGSHTIRQSLENPVVHASFMIQELNRVFKEGTILGNITGIHSGFPHKAAVTSSYCDIYVDLTVLPGEEPINVKRRFEQELSSFQLKLPELSYTTELYLSIPSSYTDYDNFFVQSGIKAWEKVHHLSFKREPHFHLNDSYIFRQWGVPTIQIGMNRRKYRDEPIGLNHGFCEIDSMIKLTKTILNIVVNVCEVE